MTDPELRGAERLKFMTEDGFGIFTDVSNKMVHTILEQGPPAALDGAFIEAGNKEHHNDSLFASRQPSSSQALHYVSHIFRAKLLGEMSGGTIHSHLQPSFFEKYGVTDAERIKGGRYCYQSGFDDADFTWYFAPAMADVAVAQMVEEGWITVDQRTALTLGDWAETIGSEWFASLMHDMSIAKFGAYGTFGRTMAQDSWGKAAFLPALQRQAVVHEYPPITDNQQPFTIEQKQTCGSTFITARLAQLLKRQLRMGMDDASMSVASTRHGQTRGCPVARRRGTLAEDTVTSGEHFKALIDRGEMTIGDSKKRGRVTFEQEHTAIDISLKGLARCLKMYDHTHGTPWLDTYRPSERHIEHRKMPTTNVLCHRD